MQLLLLIAMIYAGPMNVSSPAFQKNDRIPTVYTCEGKEINPPLSIDNIPANAKSLVLIVDDPDTDHGTFTHWVVYNIQPGRSIAENSQPGQPGLNGTNKPGYKGMCPPGGTHRYFFKVFALDAMLDIKADPERAEVEKAMAGHVIAQAQLVGLYGK